MATDFPTAIDDFTNPTATDYLNSPSHAGQHANANDAIEAIEAFIGVNGNGIHNLTEKTTPADADEVGLIDNSAESNVLKRLTWANIKAALKSYFDTLYPARDGWQPVSDSWSYASASTITVPSGAASIYQKGDRIKWTQTTVKYGVIIGVADTLLTIAVNTDYTVTNAAISNVYFSHQQNPKGYPTWFNYAPTFVGFSTPPTVVFCAYKVDGKQLTMKYRNNYGTGTSNATTFSISSPVTVETYTAAAMVGICEDNGSRFGGACIDSNPIDGKFYFYKTGGLAAWTASGTKGFEGLTITCKF